MMYILAANLMYLQINFYIVFNTGCYNLYIQVRKNLKNQNLF
jgi:hypothetical protein